MPTALLPRYGVEWRAEDDHRIVAKLAVGDEQLALRISIDDDGLVRSVNLDRWGDPATTRQFGYHPFGIEVAGSHTFPCGVTIPALGTGGWFHATERWNDREFFGYSILDLALLPDIPA